MSAERIEPQAADTILPAESNGKGTRADSDALGREVAILRARCSNLRHWCRSLLDDPASTGVLDEPTLVNLRTIELEVSEEEGQAAIARLTQGSNLSSSHPLATKIDDGSLRSRIASLTSEHEWLRRAFFALYDHLHPGDDLTDEYFLALQSQGPMHAMSDVVAEIEREFGGRP